MKITFITGSLEPGKDGVGDYTKSLAWELCSHENEISILALNDLYTDIETKKTEYRNSKKIIIYRIPSTWSARKKFSLAETWINEIDPLWISLQFVIYSYHTRGLPFGLGKKLMQLLGDRRFHIMFHELWIGFTKISSLKHKIVGRIQKSIIKNLIEITNPKFITTTNGLYSSILSRNNIQSKILPLFSNIPVVSPARNFTLGFLNKLSIDVENRNKWRIIGIFSNLYPEANLDNAITSQLNIAQELDKKLAFIGLGRINDSGIKEFNRLKEAYHGKIKFYHFGELPKADVSRMLQILDFGVSCTPKQHIGKSGVFAAMKRHGLEVLFPSEDLIPEYQSEIDQYNNCLIQRPAEFWDVAHISKEFMSLLKEH